MSVLTPIGPLRVGRSAGPVREQPHPVLAGQTACHAIAAARRMGRPVRGHPRVRTKFASPASDAAARPAMPADSGPNRSLPPARCRTDAHRATPSWPQRGSCPRTAPSGARRPNRLPRDCGCAPDGAPRSRPPARPHEIRIARVRRGCETSDACGLGPEPFPPASALSYLTPIGPLRVGRPGVLARAASPLPRARRQARSQAPHGPWTLIRPAAAARARPSGRPPGDGPRPRAFVRSRFALRHRPSPTRLRNQRCLRTRARTAPSLQRDVGTDAHRATPSWPPRRPRPRVRWRAQQDFSEAGVSEAECPGLQRSERQ